jgi:hypothetical protein
MCHIQGGKDANGDKSRVNHLLLWLSVDLDCRHPGCAVCDMANPKMQKQIRSSIEA